MSFIIYLIIAFGISMLLELIVIPRLLLISYKKKLFDEPGGRKLHSGSVSRLGGATFMPIVLFAICITVTILLYIDPTIEILQIPEIGIKQIFLEFAFLFSSLILLYFIGVKDDLIGTSYRTKFAVQILCGIFLVMSGIWLNDFNGLLGFSHIPSLVGYPLTVLIVVFIINAVNLIDGIDGLASGLSIIAFAVLSYGFYQKEYLPFAIIAMSALGCLCAFFYYNVFGIGSEKMRRKKIFMGDTGSLALGMLLAYLLIRYTMTIPTEINIFATPNPLIMFSVIIIPCFDAVTVVIGRLRRGLNPFKPDRSHLHHKFMRIGFSSHLSLIIILAMSAIFIAMNFGLIRLIQIKWILSIDIVIYALIHIWLGYKLKIVEKQTPPKTE
jgi:UDP-N-acetylmuramyl pentapeptide phosphotransferase/UDP-N-acetylglucosamine-1-phosphate transferase